MAEAIDYDAVDFRVKPTAELMAELRREARKACSEQNAKAALIVRRKNLEAIQNKIGSVRNIIYLVAADFNCTADDITSPRRNKNYIRARFTAAEIFARRGNSYPQIGRWLGNRDHTTIMHSVKSFRSNPTPEMRAVADRYAPLPDKS